MISFIIIGRNEGFRLLKCFSGVNDLIKHNSLQKCEIIYVDSDSSDSSIEIAKEYQSDKIIKLSGNVNSAIARNVGAKAANGEILFFLDGDIELSPFDLTLISANELELKYAYVVGFLDDVNYTGDWKVVSQTPRSYKSVIKDQVVTTVGGGVFIIEKITWNKFGGMDQKLKRTQDRDLSLRMARNGITGIRKSEIFGLHHTIPYKNPKRMWNMLFNGSISYKGVFIRKHLFNKAYYPIFLREDWTIIAFIFSFSMCFFTLYAPLLYFFGLIIKSKNHFTDGVLRFFGYRFLQDLVVLFSILFFFPENPSYSAAQVN